MILWIGRQIKALPWPGETTEYMYTNFEGEIANFCERCMAYSMGSSSGARTMKMSSISTLPTMRLAREMMAYLW